MQTYWDLTEQERANLTDDEMKYYGDIELMKAGLVRPVPPKLEDVGTVDVNTTEFYCLAYEGDYGHQNTLDLLFDTVEQANAFIALKPKKIKHDWQSGLDFAEDIAQPSIKPTKIADTRELNRVQDTAKAIKDAKGRNEKATAEYQKLANETSKALKDIDDDHWRCHDLEREYQHILDTKAEFLRLSKGDEAIAMQFLLNKYRQEDIDAAEAWFHPKAEEQ